MELPEGGLDLESLLLHLLRTGIGSRAAGLLCFVRGAGISYAAAKGFIGSQACGKGQGGFCQSPPFSWPPPPSVVMAAGQYGL